jgi:hypothetical protein
MVMARSVGIDRQSMLKFMLRCSALLLIVGCLGGCAGDLGQTFMVHYIPFSTIPDEQGKASVSAAIAFAKAHPLMPVAIDGFHYGQYSNEFDSLREERVRVLVFRFGEAGIDRSRIDILGKGMVYPQGSPMPSLPPDTVKITLGL